MDERLRAGVAAFNAGDFFEAHELWERLWQETAGSEQAALQGLVQIAAGYHKYAIGVSAGARKLMLRGLFAIAALPDDALGLEMADFRLQVGADLERILAGDDSGLPPPHLRRRP